MSLAASADVGSRFLETAARLGGRPALIHGGRTTTFDELAADVDVLSRAFRRLGARDGERVAMLVPPSRDFFAVAFALWRAGAVPVVVDPGIGFGNIGRCLDETEPIGFIGTPKAHAARLIANWAAGARLKVAAGGRFPGVVNLDDLRATSGEPEPPAIAADTRAAVLFTSGSTGVPKGAVYRHSQFAAQVGILQKTFGIAEGEASLATFPLFALFDIALGLTVVLPRMDFSRPGAVDPAEIIGPLQRHRVRQMFGSPALIDRVGKYGDRHGIALPDLVRVMSAGAPVQARVLRRFQGMLCPGVEIFTPYGATEALPVSVIGSKEILGETAEMTAQGAGVCVGRPVGGIEIAIIPISDGPIRTWSESLRLHQGRIGEIAVRGPVVTTHYYKRPQETALAKIGEGKSFWHRMGDLGYVDELGRLWFCGRKSQRVSTADGELYTARIEGVFNAHPSVGRSALVSVGHRPVLCVERAAESRLTESELTKELYAFGSSVPVARAVQRILYHPSFPVDVRHNAKIDREALAVWAAKNLDR